GGADGNGAYTDLAEIANNETVVIHYRMSGTGEFHPIDAFLVGVDPMFSASSQTAHKISIVSGSIASNHESFMALVSSVLVLIAAMVRVKRR
ncbi:MAG: hypothetical protein ACXQT3_03305, partial [Methermicoccaceae archaeon]